MSGAVVGSVLGSVAIIAVLWRFIDPLVEAWSAGYGQPWAKWVSRVGLAEVWVAPAAILFVIGLVAGRRHLARWSLFMMIAIVASGVVVNALKLVVERERPMRPDELGPWAFSFPSGHATTIASVATVFVLLQPRCWPFAALVAALVATARVCNHGHFASDVVAGALLGVVVTLACQWLWTRVHSTSAPV